METRILNIEYEIWEFWIWGNCHFGKSWILVHWGFARLGKWDFGNVGFGASGILGKLDFRKSHLGNWDFGELLGSLDLGKLSFWKKLDFGTLGFYKVEIFGK